MASSFWGFLACHLGPLRHTGGIFFHLPNGVTPGRRGWNPFKTTPKQVPLAVKNTHPLVSQLFKTSLGCQLNPFPSPPLPLTPPPPHRLPLLPLLRAQARQQEAAQRPCGVGQDQGAHRVQLMELGHLSHSLTSNKRFGCGSLPNNMGVATKIKQEGLRRFWYPNNMGVATKMKRSGQTAGFGTHVPTSQGAIVVPVF